MQTASTKPRNKNGKSTKSAIWEIFEEMRKEMIEVKHTVNAEIEQAKAEKKMIEANLDTICAKHANKWRKIKTKLTFLITRNRKEVNQKLHGVPIITSAQTTDYEKFERISNVVIKKSALKVRRKCIIYPGSMFTVCWGYFLIVLLMYTIIMVPLSLAVIDYAENMMLFYVDLVVNVFFLIDIFVNMCTALDEERDSRYEILCSYAQSWLIFDIIAIFPFEFFVEEGFYSLKILTKVPRFMRLARVFKLLKLGGNFKRNQWYKKLTDILSLSPALVKLIQFFVTMLIIIHVTGCLWLFIAKLNDYGPDTWVFE